MFSLHPIIHFDIKNTGHTHKPQRFRCPGAVERASLCGWLRAFSYHSAQSVHTPGSYHHALPVLIPRGSACSQHCAHTSTNTCQGLPSTIPRTLSGRLPSQASTQGCELELSSSRPGRQGRFSLSSAGPGNCCATHSHGQRRGTAA